MRTPKLILICSLLLVSTGFHPAVRSESTDPGWVSGGFFTKEQVSGDIAGSSRTVDAGSVVGQDSFQVNSPSADQGNLAPLPRETPRSGWGAAKSDEDPIKLIDEAVRAGGDQDIHKQQKRAVREMLSREEIEGVIETSKDRVKEIERKMKSLSHKDPEEYLPPEHLSERKSSRVDSPDFFSVRKGEESGSKVSLIVNADPWRHCEEAIENLMKLNSDRDVLISDVVVVGNAEIKASLLKTTMKNLGQSELADMLKSGAKEPEASAAKEIEKLFAERTVAIENKLKQDFKLALFNYVNVPELLKKYDVKYSPVWVVEYLGKTYVIEGTSNVWSYFTRSGVFLPANDRGSPAVPQEQAREKSPGSVDIGEDKNQVIKIRSASSGNTISASSDTDKVFRPIKPKDKI